MSRSLIGESRVHPDPPPRFRWSSLQAKPATTSCSSRHACPKPTPLRVPRQQNPGQVTEDSLTENVLLLFGNQIKALGVPLMAVIYWPFSFCESVFSLPDVAIKLFAVEWTFDMHTKRQMNWNKVRPLYFTSFGTKFDFCGILKHLVVAFIFLVVFWVQSPCFQLHLWASHSCPTGRCAWRVILRKFFSHDRFFVLHGALLFPNCADGGFLGCTSITIHVRNEVYDKHEFSFFEHQVFFFPRSVPTADRNDVDRRQKLMCVKMRNNMQMCQKIKVIIKLWTCLWKSNFQWNFYALFCPNFLICGFFVSCFAAEYPTALRVRDLCFADFAGVGKLRLKLSLVLVDPKDSDLVKRLAVGKVRAGMLKDHTGKEDLSGAQSMGPVSFAFVTLPGLYRKR